MADVFISYARDDRAVAYRLANACEKRNWSVWWDQRLNAGDLWDEVIEAQLHAARCIVVIWSRNSIKSRWVRTEAADGLHRGILLPIIIDDARPPLQFQLVQAEYIPDECENARSAGLARLLSSISMRLEGLIAPASPIVSAPEPASHIERRASFRHPHDKFSFLLNRSLMIAVAIIITILSAMLLTYDSYHYPLPAAVLDTLPNAQVGSIQERDHQDSNAAIEGLAPIASSKGTLIAYATQPGGVATASPDDISPFTDSVVKHITTTNASALKLFQDISIEVATNTGGRQVPHIESYLFTDFSFNENAFAKKYTPVALVIGNSEYLNANIPGSADDAQVMATTLKNMGFYVIKKRNLQQKQMFSVVRDFANRLGPNVLSLFYYSGHAISINNTMYMIPVDAGDALNETNIEELAIPLTSVLARMEMAGGGPNILILDGCRNNPYERRFK